MHLRLLLGFSAVVLLGGFATPLPADVTVGWEQRAPAITTPPSIEMADLAAQERMANAAEDLTKLTLLQVWIGVAGAIAVAGSLYYSARAAHAGFRAAKAAEASLIAENRPILVVKLASMVAVNAATSALRENGKTPYTFAFSNEGRGVAWITSYGSYTCVTPLNFSGDFELPAVQHDQYWPLAPNDKWGDLNNSGSADISEADRIAVAEGRSELFFIGRVTYKGASSEDYIIDFVYKYRLDDHALVPYKHHFWRAT